MTSRKERRRQKKEMECMEEKKEEKFELKEQGNKATLNFNI